MEIRDQAIILFFLKTGMRLGEMASPDVPDVELERGLTGIEGDSRRSIKCSYSMKRQSYTQKVAGC